PDLDRLLSDDFLQFLDLLLQSVFAAARSRRSIFEIQRGLAALVESFAPFVNDRVRYTALAGRTPPQKLNTTCFSTKSLSVVGPMLPAETPPRVAGWSDILIYTDPRRAVC